MRQPADRDADGAAPAASQPRDAGPDAPTSLSATLEPGKVGAHCDKGLLILDGAIPPLGPYVLPGNNYHVYDYALFWGAIRRDARAEAGGMAALITIELGRIRRRSARWRQARRARRRHQDHRPRDLRRRAGASPARAETIRRTKFTADLEALRAFVEREHIVGLVVGLPLNLDGSDSARAPSRSARSRATSRRSSLPILLWDERWSTQAVERAMIDADVSRAKRAEKVDALAAAHILQGAIDALANLSAPQ